MELEETVPVPPVHSLVESAVPDRASLPAFSLTLPYKTDEDLESQKVNSHLQLSVSLSMSFRLCSLIAMLS
jgi:hypothetical protein